MRKVSLQGLRQTEIMRADSKTAYAFSSDFIFISFFFTFCIPAAMPIPWSEALEANCRKGLLEMLKAAEEAARQGMENTKNYQALFSII